MNVPEEDHRILEEFIHESLEMVERAFPFVRALVEQPDREDILPEVTRTCFRLFHSIKGTGGFLHLEHLVRPAEVMEYLLDRVQSGVQPLALRHVSLLAESCQFMEQGLPLVLAEKSDKRLAVPSDALATAILRSIYANEANSWAKGTVVSIPPEMRDTFLWEVEKLMATAEQEFVLWDFIAVDHQRVAKLCRLLHRLRQNFALYELSDLERLCMALESTLYRFLQGEFFQTEYPERSFLRSIDAVRNTIAQFINMDDATVSDLDHHLAALQGLIRQPIGMLLVEAGMVDPAKIAEALEMQKSSRDENPRRLGEVLVDMGEMTQEQLHYILREQHNKRTRAEQAASALESSCSSLFTLSSAATVACHEVCIDGRKFARIEALINQLVASRPVGALAPLLAELQELAQSCNQDALSTFSNRLRRTVHGLAIQLNKRVHFVIEGIDELLDQHDRVLLADPLLHLLRNGVEYGLETPEERRQAGKSRSGRLTLSVLRHGNEIWVSVEDDGRGIDIQKIATMSVERGLITPEMITRLTGRELMQFFVAPSATEQDSPGGPRRVTGLSAVQASLLQMQGELDITSRSGKGTRIMMKVPRQH